MTDARFTPAIITAAQVSHAKFWPYGPFVSITLAQWAVESGYGAHQSGKNNFFGIKATQAQISAGLATEVYTKEYLHGMYHTMLQYFADYPDLASGFSDHAKLLVSHHYLPCMRAATPEAYAQALHTCGYATAPNYASTLMSVITSNNLTQFDECFTSTVGKINCMAVA